MPRGVDRRRDSVPGRTTPRRRTAGTNGEPLDATTFLRALIGHAVAEASGDAIRFDMAGVSSGGFLVPRVACETGDKVAAVADVIGMARQPDFQGCDPVPVTSALIASTIDDASPCTVHQETE